MCFACSDSTVPGDADPGRVDEHVQAAEALAVLGDDAHAILLLPMSAATASAPSSAAAASIFSCVREASVRS